MGKKPTRITCTRAHHPHRLRPGKGLATGSAHASRRGHGRRYGQSRTAKLMQITRRGKNRRGTHCRRAAKGAMSQQAATWKPCARGLGHVRQLRADSQGRWQLPQTPAGLGGRSAACATGPRAQAQRPALAAQFVAKRQAAVFNFAMCLLRQMLARMRSACLGLRAFVVTWRQARQCQRGWASDCLPQDARHSSSRVSYAATAVARSNI